MAISEELEGAESCDSEIGKGRTEVLVEGVGCSSPIGWGSGEAVVSCGEDAAESGGDGPAGPKRVSLLINGGI